MKVSQISRSFSDFFSRIGYMKLPGAPLLDPSVPMSFVMSAGLVQVESALITSQSSRQNDKYTLTQKCFRHFDVTRVGQDDIHLSYFEMPGAFAFGPIDKFEVIRRMWSLLSQFSLEPNNLWASVFGGGDLYGVDLPADYQTYEAWLTTSIPKDHVIFLGKDHNYWVQGDGIQNLDLSRKCGPNTEVFWENKNAPKCNDYCLPGCQCGRFIEISNSLFIDSFINVTDPKILAMDLPFAETVIGSERLATILQGKVSVFDIDIFLPFIEQIAAYQITEDDPIYEVQERILVDHLRALINLVADGAPPPWGEKGSKGGRFRLIRILVRRLLTAKILLKIEDPDFFPRLVDRYIDENKEQDLISSRDKVLFYLSRENERFSQTLDIGLKKFNELLVKKRMQGFPGTEALFVEKVFGLPRDIIEDELLKRGLGFDNAGYRHAQKAWKQKGVLFFNELGLS